MNSHAMLKACQNYWELSDTIVAEIELTDDQKRSLDEVEKIMRRYLQHLANMEDQGDHLVK